MGVGRTLPKLLTQYHEKSQIIPQFQPPTESYSTLQTWAKQFGWPARAAEYDAGWEARKNAEREAVMNYGLALDYERAQKLMRLADFLEAQLYERGVTYDADGKPTDKPGTFHNVWVPDVKSIGGGEYAERVDIERFNSAIFEQYRGVLDDLAKETGGRVKKSEVSGKDGGPVKFEVVWADDIKRTDSDTPSSP